VKKDKSKKEEVEVEVEEEDDAGHLKKYEIDVNFWLASQIPKGRTKIDLSKNRKEYIALMIARVTYRELEMIAREKYGEHITRQTFDNYYLQRVPEEVKNPIGRMEKFIKEAPYRINELLLLEELVEEQRNRFFQCKKIEDQLNVPMAQRSIVARDYHAILVAFQEAKMRAGLITRAPERIEITGGTKSVSDYTDGEKGRELKRIDDKFNQRKESDSQ